jgi:hypothetical protein
MARVHFEQAVYGSFPFWDRGYAVLAQSPGCRPEWLDDFRAACQRYGEPPRGAAEVGALFALRLPSGPWAVVGVGPPGADDRGRPGALAFHGLFVAAREFRKVGFDPFALAGELRRQWGPETTTLPSGSCTVEAPAPTAADDDPACRRATAALLAGRRVAIESAEPIDGLARAVWSRLPPRIRRRASVATLAYGNGNRFDLVALPRLAGVELDASYLDPREPGEEIQARSGPEAGRRRKARLALAGAGALAVGGLLGAIWAGSGGRGGEESPGAVAQGPPPSPPAVEARPPEASAYRGDRLTDEERRLALEGLVDLADRFGIEPAGRGAEAVPVALMARLADRLRYRGPLLSADERARLAGESSPDTTRALAWDRQVRRFVADRPLPADFARGPLRWQLATLAWSFHLDSDPRRPAAEAPYDLADALSVDGPVSPSSLAGRYPALADYARFLGRLPRR